MAPKPKVKPRAPQAPKHKSAGTGLQLSAAQWKAYGAAYSASASAAYRQLAIQSAANTLRRSRLNAAYSLSKKAAAAHTAARTAAIAAFAVSQSYRQSRLAHQNAALRQRVYADFERHVLLAARLQYIYQGEKVYAHTAVMRTLTSAQALSATEARFNQAARSAKSALRVTPGSSPSPQRQAQLAGIRANAKAAALAAARATPKGRTAPRPARPGVMRTARPGRRAYGDPDGYDCVAAAIANCYRARTAVPLAPGEYAALAAGLGDAPSIGEALEYAAAHWEKAPGKPVLADFAPVPAWARDGCVIGFATERGPHAAYCPGPRYIVSWGELLPLGDVMTGSEVEEAWALLWK